MPGRWSPPASVAPWTSTTIARWCQTLDAGECDPPSSSATRSRRSPMSLPSSHALGAVVKTRAFDLEQSFLHAVQGPVAQTPPRVVFFEIVCTAVRLLLRSDGVTNDTGTISVSWSSPDADVVDKTAIFVIPFRLHRRCVRIRHAAADARRRCRLDTPVAEAIPVAASCDAGHESPPVSSVAPWMRTTTIGHWCRSGVSGP